MFFSFRIFLIEKVKEAIDRRIIIQYPNKRDPSKFKIPEKKRIKIIVKVDKKKVCDTFFRNMIA